LVFGKPTVRSISFALSTFSWNKGKSLYLASELSITTTGVFLLLSLFIA